MTGRNATEIAPLIADSSSRYPPFPKAQVASGTATGNFSDSSFPTVAKAGGLNFVGKMDEFRFFSRALNAGEISGRSGQQPSCQD
ncbi:MAG: hypothetical protein VB835_00755 [Pirellulales bacterium]